MSFPCISKSYLFKTNDLKFTIFLLIVYVVSMTHSYNHLKSFQFVPKLGVGRRYLPFQQISTLRSTLLDPPIVNQDVNILERGNRDRRDLTVFVIDTSFPGGSQRIDAVCGAIGKTLPKERAAVVTCFEDTAELSLEPTGSLIYADKRLSNIRRSVMGNLGVGLSKALDVVEMEFSQGTGRITIAIIANSKAHGLVSGTLDCLQESELMCNNELLDSASAIADAKKKANLNQQQLRVLVVDTEAEGKRVQSTESSSEEGFHLARVSDANYFHFPNLSDKSLAKLLEKINA